MTKRNYQITWAGQVVSVVVGTLAEAEILKQKELEAYQKDYADGWVKVFDPSLVVIQTTTKRTGTS